MPRSVNWVIKNPSRLRSGKPGPILTRSQLVSRVNRCDISAPSQISQYSAMPRTFFEERQQWASAEGPADKTKNLIEKSVVQRRDSGRELWSRMRRTKKFVASREGTEGIRSDQAARFGERRFPSRRDRTERGGIVVRMGEPRATYPERGGKGTDRNPRERRFVRVSARTFDKRGGSVCACVRARRGSAFTGPSGHTIVDRRGMRVPRAEHERWKCRTQCVPTSCSPLLTMCQAASSSPSLSLPFLPPFSPVLSSAELAPSDACVREPEPCAQRGYTDVWCSRGPSVQWPNTTVRQRRATARYLRGVGYRRGRFGETERTHTSAPTYGGTWLYARLVHTSELGIIGDN